MSKIGRHVLEMQEGKGSAHFVIKDGQIYPALGSKEGEQAMQNTAWNIHVDLAGSRPLSKKEIAYRKKFQHRLKEVQRFLGRVVSPEELSDIHTTLTKELDESTGK